jgi:hypothetical protein
MRDALVRCENEVDHRSCGFALCLRAHVVAQYSIDITLHILSDERWEHHKMVPSLRQHDRVDYGYDLLAQVGVIEFALTAEIRNTLQRGRRIRFRYQTLDAERIWRELPATIGALEGWTHGVAVFLARRDQ